LLVYLSIRSGKNVLLSIKKEVSNDDTKSGFSEDAHNKNVDCFFILVSYQMFWLARIQGAFSIINNSYEIVFNLK